MHRNLHLEDSMQDMKSLSTHGLASNIFSFEGDSYLLIVDYTSQFPIIRKLSSITRKAIAHHMQSIFSKYRWPDTLVTDNGPCYTSKEFQLLMQTMSVNHLSSSPHYPQSNGLAEKFVGIVKNLSHKAKEEGQSHTLPLWPIEIHLSMELYSHQCRFYKVDKLVLTYHCCMLPKCKWLSTMHPNQLLKFLCKG